MLISRVDCIADVRKAIRVAAHHIQAEEVNVGHAEHL